MALAVAASACGGGSKNGSSNNPQTSKFTKQLSSINPATASKMKDGGSVKLPLSSEFPTQWNYNQINGPNDSTSQVIGPLLGGPYKVTPAGQIVPDPNYVVSWKLTSKSPETITYELNKKAVSSDGTPVSAKDYIAT